MPNPHPGSFPVGSLESRAAARAMLARSNKDSRMTVRFISARDGRRAALDGARCTCARNSFGETHFCYCFTRKAQEDSCHTRLA
jgi:hypothetical protein